MCRPCSRPGATACNRWACRPGATRFWTARCPRWAARGCSSKNWKRRSPKAAPTSPCIRSRTCRWNCPPALRWPACSNAKTRAMPGSRRNTPRSNPSPPLPPGAVVGPSSLRRQALLQALRPDLRMEPLRGNLDTRLRKLDAGQYQAIVLAVAGLKRLGLEARIRAPFAPAALLPAAGQGALGIEVRSERQDLCAALAALAHQPSWLAVAAERAVSRAMGGSCSMPLAAYGQFHGAVLQLDAAWGDPQGQAPLVRAQASATVTTLAQAEALGSALARRLCADGARPLVPVHDPAHGLVHDPVHDLAHDLGHDLGHTPADGLSHRRWEP